MMMYYIVSVLFLMSVWCPCKAINGVIKWGNAVRQRNISNTVPVPGTKGNVLFSLIPLISPVARRTGCSNHIDHTWYILSTGGCIQGLC